MIDFRRCARAARDFDELVDAFQQPVAFRAHVADVAAAALRRLGRQRNQLVGLGKGCRRIDQRGADAERAFLHRLPHQRAHPLELLRGGVDIGLAKLVLADGGCADERGHVHRRAAPFQKAQIVA
jgi:hypothetical protein